ncbi:hypothetical protein HMPREF1051_2943 [Neisseria sicca VK64]|uniref:Uncharacterized protein n=1 Tax=Neisseria sicca VK64 TaxID=1095748 RepID=I2NVM8_NEISI|nr:hypothetical protein HMPREF1051_2943 [Neisseria sicca VK64]
MVNIPHTIVRNMRLYCYLPVLSKFISFVGAGSSERCVKRALLL